MEEGERKNPGVAKEYRNDEIVVLWEPDYCIHVAACLMGLPQVFDVQRRPWISINAANADAIAQVVMRCPTGALHYKRLDGAPDEEAAAETTVTPWPNGPLFVRGRVRLADRRGGTIREDTRVALCRCGASANKPFCDGTHRAIGFTSDDPPVPAPASASDGDSAS
ncbi:MAG: (4Fe-4S)-binding protein [Dehalococcoidia bacterium]